MRSVFVAFAIWSALTVAGECASLQPASPLQSPRAHVTIENWDKGGALSRWVYTHVSEVFPSAVVRRGGAIVDLPLQLRPEIGGLKLNKPGEPEQTLDQFVNNGAVDGCIVLHDGKIVYEKYPTIHPDDLHVIMSITKAFVLTALAILEDQGKIDLTKPVEHFLPELKASDWAGTRLRDLVDVRSGMEDAETGNDAYRNPAHKQFQLEATLGWQPRTAPQLSEAARTGDLFGMLCTIKRERRPVKNGLTPAATRSCSAKSYRESAATGRHNQRSHLEQGGGGATCHSHPERARLSCVRRGHCRNTAGRRAVWIVVHEKPAGWPGARDLG